MFRSRSPLRSGKERQTLFPQKAMKCPHCGLLNPDSRGSLRLRLRLCKWYVKTFVPSGWNYKNASSPMAARLFNLVWHCKFGIHSLVGDPGGRSNDYAGVLGRSKNVSRCRGARHGIHGGMGHRFSYQCYSLGFCCVRRLAWFEIPYEIN